MTPGGVLSIMDYMGMLRPKVAPFGIGKEYFLLYLKVFKRSKVQAENPRMK